MKSFIDLHRIRYLLTIFLLSTLVACSGGDYELKQAFSVGGLSSDKRGAAVQIDGAIMAVTTEDPWTVEIYTRFGERWSLRQTLVAHGQNSGLVRFGKSLALFDGYLAVGAPIETLEDGYATDYGYVNLYKWQSSTNTFSLVQIIRPDIDLVEDANHHFFGGTVALNKNYLAISDMADERRDGKVYVYKKSVLDWYTAFVSYENPDGYSDQYFGHALALDSDVLAVGAPRQYITNSQAEENRPGQVFVYILSYPNQSPISLSLPSRPPTDPLYGVNNFGMSLALAKSQLAVGGNNYLAYYRRLNNGTWLRVDEGSFEATTLVSMSGQAKANLAFIGNDLVVGQLTSLNNAGQVNILDDVSKTAPVYETQATLYAPNGAAPQFGAIVDADWPYVVVATDNAPGAQQDTVFIYKDASR